MTIQNAGFRERNNDLDKIFKRRITAKYFLIVDDNYIDKKPYQSFQEMGGKLIILEDIKPPIYMDLNDNRRYSLLASFIFYSNKRIYHA